MNDDNENQELPAPDEPNNWQRPFSMAGQTEADRQKLIELRKADRNIITIKERQDIFIEEYLRCKNKRKALDACGETYPTLAKWRGKDAEFAQKYMIAVMEICDEMEDEAYRRGVQGVTKPIFYAGKHVGDVQEYSDALLMFSLKGMMPEKYRENSGVSVGVGGSTVLIMPSNGRELGKVSDLAYEELPPEKQSEESEVKPEQEGVDGPE